MIPVSAWALSARGSPGSRRVLTVSAKAAVKIAHVWLWLVYDGPRARWAKRWERGDRKKTTGSAWRAHVLVLAGGVCWFDRLALPAIPPFGFLQHLSRAEWHALRTGARQASRVLFPPLLSTPWMEAIPRWIAGQMTVLWVLVPLVSWLLLPPLWLKLAARAAPATPPSPAPPTS